MFLLRQVEIDGLGLLVELSFGMRIRVVVMEQRGAEMSRWLSFLFIRCELNSNPSARELLSLCRCPTGNGYWFYVKLEHVMCK